MSDQDTQQYTSVTGMQNERVSQVDAPPLPEEQREEKVDLATEPSQPSHKSRSSPSSRRRNYRKRSASESPERSPNRRSPDHSPLSHRRRRNSDYKGNLGGFLFIGTTLFKTVFFHHIMQSPVNNVT